MTLNEFKDLLLTADPAASHYKSTLHPNYTVWAEYGTNDLAADDKTAERAWKVQIDRYTTIENDPIAAAITAKLDENEISYDLQVDSDPTTGYIRHIWACEVI